MQEPARLRKRSVWDFPRPPAIEPEQRRARVFLAGRCIADSTDAIRVLETSHPPTIYFPARDVDRAAIDPIAGSSFCEYKGLASYWDVLANGDRRRRAAWSYLAPSSPYESLRNRIAFYPSRVDECRLDDEIVLAQAGDFYGGWITSELTGPFKGEPGTAGW